MKLGDKSMQRNYFFILIIFLIFNTFLFAQNRDRFEITPRQGADRELVKGATVYIVHVDTGDSLQLTEYSGTRAGTYYRDNVPYGLYKIYVNGTLVRNNYPFGVDRTRTFIEAVDSDGDNKIETAGIEDGAVTANKLATNAVTKTKIANGNINWEKLEATVYSDQIVSINNDYLDIDISALGYNSPRVILVNKGGWPVYIESVTSNTIRVGLGPAGYGEQAKFDLIIINE